MNKFIVLFGVVVLWTFFQMIKDTRVVKQILLKRVMSNVAEYPKTVDLDLSRSYYNASSIKDFDTNNIEVQRIPMFYNMHDVLKTLELGKDDFMIDQVDYIVLKRLNPCFVIESLTKDGRSLLIDLEGMKHEHRTHTGFVDIFSLILGMVLFLAIISIVFEYKV